MEFPQTILPKVESNEKPVQDPFDKIEGRWTLEKVLGAGSFGTVYRGIDTWTGQIVAIKQALQGKEGTVKTEKRFYDILWKKGENLAGIPRIFYGGWHNCSEVMVMQCVGPSLLRIQDLFQRNFSLKTIFLIAIQALERLETIHERGIVHQDIKPENMAMGLKDIRTLYLVDFGLAGVFQDAQGHFPPEQDYGFVGSPEYASLNAHLYRLLSRRDDLESLGYSLVAMYKGGLPWSHIYHDNWVVELDEIGLKKKNTTLEDLCADMGNEMVQFMRIVRRMDYEETPNYHYLRALFQFSLRRLGHDYDYEFDWLVRPVEASHFSRT